MGRFAQSWTLFKASWGVLKKENTLAIFPIISSLAAFVIFLLFAFPLYASLKPSGEMAEYAKHVAQPGAATYILAFCMYVCSFAVAFFCNAALIFCTFRVLGGEDTSVKDGIRFAVSRLPQILSWAVVCATIGMILRAIEERAGLLGRIVIAVIGMAWAAASMLVVPVIVAEGKGPIDSLKESVNLLKKTWGESLIGFVGLHVAFSVITIPLFLLLVVGIVIATSSLAIGLFVVALAGVSLVVAAIIQSTLTVIYRAAIYRYAKTGDGFGEFDGELLKQCAREKRKGFFNR